MGDKDLQLEEEVGLDTAVSCRVEEARAGCTAAIGSGTFLVAQNN